MILEYDVHGKILSSGAPYDNRFISVILQQIRDSLNGQNIGHRTLVETPEGTRVEVLDKSSQLAGQIRRVAQRYETNIEHKSGRGQFIGAKTRKESKTVYQRIVDAYEKKHGIRASGDKRNASGFLNYPHSGTRQELAAHLPNFNLDAAVQDLICSVQIPESQLRILGPTTNSKKKPSVTWQNA